MNERKIVDYIRISRIDCDLTETTGIISDAVNYKIKQGYQTFGHPIISKNKILQAMIKYED